MNIPSITNMMPKFAGITSNVKNNFGYTNYGLKMDEPIQQDTLSFKSSKVSKATKRGVRLLKNAMETTEVATKENDGISNKVAENQKKLTEQLLWQFITKC